ncbi:hypothetical protein JHK87_050082 [Glycine soja]|nr:hypothetical protein JHK87_050082 [Glycine soja]
MDYIAHFQVRSWGIAEFWADEFKKANARSQKAQAKLTKANRLWSKLPRQMKVSCSRSRNPGSHWKLAKCRVLKDELKSFEEGLANGTRNARGNLRHSRLLE